MANNRKRLEYIIQARNDAKSTLKDAGVDLNQLSKEAQQAAVALELLGNAETKFSRTAKAAAVTAKQAMGTMDLAGAVRKSVDAAAATAAAGGTKIGRSLRNSMEAQMKMLRKDLYSIQGTLTGLVNNFVSRFAIFLSGYAVFSGGKAMIGDAAYIEQQRTALEALTGSAKEAGTVISWVREQAWKTPFQFPDLVESVTQLRSVGMDYRKWFSSIGNLAMMSGRPLSEGLEMTVRAITRLKSGATGEALELLRRLKVSMADFKAQGIQFGAGNRLLGSPERALEALMLIIQTKFPGVMEKAENTASVAFSNIIDAAREAGYAIMGIDEAGGVISGGVLDKLKRTALELLEEFKTHKKDIQQWGEQVGQAVIRIINAIKQLPQWWERNVWWISLVVKTTLTLSLISKIFPVLRVLATIISIIVGMYKQWIITHSVISAMTGQWANVAAGVVAAVASYTILNKVMGLSSDLMRSQIKNMQDLNQAFEVAAGPSAGKPLKPEVLAKRWKELEAARKAVRDYNKEVTGKNWDKHSFDEKMALNRKQDEIKDIERNVIPGLERLLSSHGYDTTTGQNTPKLFPVKPEEMTPNWSTQEDALESATKAWSKYADSVGRLKGDTSREYEEALKSSRPYLVDHAKLLTEAAKSTRQFTVEWYAAQTALLDANIAISDVDAKLKKLSEDREKEAKKAREDAAKQQKEYIKNQLDMFKEFKDDAKFKMDYSENFGSDSSTLANKKAYIESLITLRDRIQGVLPVMGVFTEEGRQFRQELREITTAIAEEQKSLRDIPIQRVEGQLSAAQAYLNMMKQLPSNKTGVAKQATMAVINLEREKLGILEEQLALAEQMGRLNEADKLRAQIYGVKGEILSMQKDLRNNLETEFDKMAVKIINAPKDLSRTLARSGITLWQKQMDAMSKMISLPQGNLAYAGAGSSAVAPVTQVAPPNVDVRVQIDGQDLMARVEGYVDKRIAWLK